MSKKKIKDFVTKHKALLIIAGVILLIFVASQFDQQKSTKPVAESKRALQPPTKELVGAALQETGTPGSESSITAPSPAQLQPSETMLQTSNTPSAVIIERQSQKQVTKKKKTTKDAPMTRPTSALERIRGIYDVDYVPETLITVSGTLVTPTEPPPAAEKPVPAQEAPVVAQVEPKKHREVLLPGAFFKVKLVNGLLATSDRESNFTGVVSRLVAPGFESRDYEDCMAYGKAILDAKTTRVVATVSDVSCPDRHVSLETYAQDSDYIEGIRGRFYSQVTKRILLSMTPGALSEYAAARREAFEENSTVTSVQSDTVVQDKKISDPEKYAAYASAEVAAQSIADELALVKDRTVAMNVVDPLTTVTFFVTAPSDVNFLYEETSE